MASFITGWCISVGWIFILAPLFILKAAFTPD